MRVCLVSSELAPFQGWGIGAATGSLAKALRDAGHEVHLLIDDLPGLRERGGIEFSGIHIHILEPSDFAGALDQVPCECTRRPLVVHRRLKALHARLRFDAIEFNDFFADGYFAFQARRTSGEYAGAILAVHLHSPILLLRELNGQSDYDLDISLITHMEATCIREADVLFAPSRAILERLGPLEGLGTSLRDVDPRIAVIPYAMPAVQPPPMPSAGSSSREVLFFGRLETRKGAADLIEAASILLREGVDLTVRLVGVDTDCGPGRRSLREHLRRGIEPALLDRFTFEDNQPREVIAGYIRSAAVCCFPALWDNYPNACLEAMALGACVVASRAGGMGEMIEDGHSGLLVDPSNPDALAAALREALSNPSRRASLGMEAVRRVAALTDPKQVAERHIEVLRASHATSCHRVSEVRERVAVVIPVYNLGRYLPAAVASVRAQTRPVDELLLIDDGSSDAGTLKVLARLEHEGVRVIRQNNLGLARARNAGFEAAVCEWVVPLDADDLLAPTFVERALDAAARMPGVSLVGTHMACFTSTPDAPCATYVPLGFLYEALPAANVASSAIALLRRDAVLHAGGYDPAMTAYEDWELYCRLAASGHTAAIIPEPLILNRIRADSMLRSLSETEDQTLRAEILARHMPISPRPDRTARIVLAAGSRESASAAPRPLPLRYRVADRVRDVSRALGVKDALKEVARLAVPPGPSEGPGAGE